MILKNNIFSPYNIIALYLIGFFLYSLGLANNISEPSLEFVMFTAFSIALSYFGVFLGINLKRAAPLINTRKKQTCTSSKKRAALVILYFCTILFFLFEFLNFYTRYGNIPLFLNELETARFDFAYNGYVHMIALSSSTILTILLCDLIAFSKSYGAKYRTLIITISLISAFLVIIQGNRGELLKIMIPVLIFFTLARKTILNNSRIMIVFFITTIFALGFFKYYRDLNFFGDSLNRTIDNNWVLGCSESLPINCSLFFSYLSLSMNYSMLNTYISLVQEHTFGYFTLIHPFYSLLPGDQYSLIDYQQNKLGMDFHGFLTPTVYGVLYIDYGPLTPFMCIPLFMIIGVLFKRAISTQKISNLLMYSIVCWYFILGVYTYPFTEFYVFFNIFITYFVSRIIFGKKTLDRST
jgi:oligosaccharide repeat unit polymerase